jgi:hypothetical protein
MRSATAFGSIILILTGCGYDRGNGVAYPAGDATTVTLSLPSTGPFTSAGDTRSVTAVVRDINDAVISAPAVSWRTSAPSVATVVGSGETATITAVDDGTAIITASSGRADGTVTVTVRRRVVSIELSAPDSVIVAGFTTQLTIVGRDGRQNAITGLTGATFASSNLFSVMVSPTGLVTALFSSFRPFDAIVTATLTRDGETFSAAKRIDVADAAPAAFDFSALMESLEVRPEPVNSAAEGIIFLTLDGPRVRYKMLWSLLEGPPVSAHIHGPDLSDNAADILVDLPLGNETGQNGTLIGSFSAADIHPQGGQPAISLDSLVALFQTPARVYVDVHTTLFGDGEIRGSVFRRR